MSTNLFAKERLMQTGDVTIKAMGASMLIGLPFMVTCNLMFMVASALGSSAGRMVGTGGCLVLLGGGIAQLVILFQGLQAGLA